MQELDLLEKTKYTVLPLKDLVIFPHMVVPLIVGRQPSIEAVELAMVDDKILFLVAQKDSLKEDISPRDLYRVGVVGRILQLVKLPNGLEKILVEGLVRGKVRRYTKNSGMIEARIDFPVEEMELTDKLEAKKRQLVTLFKKYIKMNEEIPEEILFSFNQLDDLEKLSDFVATYLDVKIDNKQKFLEKWKVEERVDYLLSVLRKENHVLSIKSDLDVKVRDQMLKSQRHFYLQEQLRVIREELGEEDELSGEMTMIRERIMDAGMPEDVTEKALEELQRLAKIPPLSPEFNVIRTYLDWLVAVPWSKATTDELIIKKVQKILDEDHYGLNKPKKRILEFIAVLKRVETMQGAILCIVGPPGVGKTSLGRSIARAMSRKFVRISLGGIHDEAEIRGHRRTYIGALPGKIIQGMKKAGTRNPVFLLDEIDKVGSDYRGDPSSALLEVLDPEQNKSFMDHYLEVEYDLSHVMFIVTANNPDDIPEPLRDRMELIEIPGYHDYEKLQIAKRHLIPKQLERNGLDKGELVFRDDALTDMIMNYTLEAGVRNLEREISRVCRRSVVQLTQNRKNKSIEVKKQNLKKILGEPKYLINPLKSEKEIGVATGLAWTPYGGDILRIEINLMPGKDKVTMTGKLGDVMQESVSIALSFLRSRSAKYKINQDFINKYDIHVHLPEGAVPKDGPSAGITLTTALLSALKKEPFPPDLAMTGEITLRGKILEIGGLNEKLLAAKRMGIKSVILPEENRRDINEIDKEVSEGLELIFVKNYDEVYKLIFGKKGK